MSEWMSECTVCGTHTELPHSCTYCGHSHCSSHQLPENHECSELRYQHTNSGWFRETNSMADRTRPARSTPKPMDSSEITTYGGGGRGSKPGSYGPDLAPDGSLIYKNGEEPDKSTASSDRLSSIKRRAGIYHERLKIMLSPSFSLFLKIVMVTVLVYSILFRI